MPRRTGLAAWSPKELESIAVKVSPENFVKVTLMAIVGIALGRLIAARFGIAGLTELIG